MDSFTWLCYLVSFNSRLGKAQFYSLPGHLDNSFAILITLGGRVVSHASAGDPVAIAPLRL